ncbi:type VII secretion-associated serine protease mycosin [Plantactinospora sp. CA-290183]|uniref:type VII secretion-associated serine protease mycosin n=1 Tax=Plantactinospora sp. CA-290183 TaxID=3240006 RepID=UPI003D8D27A4
MAGRRVRRTLVGALVAASVLPTIAGPAAAAAVPRTGLALPGCTSTPAPVEPVKAMPWAQQRYAPERLAPLATGEGVTVAVIDSGVDKTHVQMRGRVARGADFLDAGLDGTRDCQGHGTGVASIIAATPRNGIGFHGLAPKAKILPVRVSEQLIIEGEQSGETVTAAEFAQAIRWAVDNGADVINMSVVLYEDNPAVRSATAYAVAEDIVVVAAAGNLHEEGDPRPYPAAYDGVIGVGAVGQDGVVAPFSQRGDYVDLVAPGGKVLAAVPEQGHKEEDGTSYAAPFVAGTAALIRDYQPDLSAAEVAARLVATADPAAGNRRQDYGAGVLNPYRAVTDTAAPARRQPAGGLPAEEVDPVAVARAERRSVAQERALWVAGVAGTVAGLALLLATVLPQGMRRRWRPAGPA